MQPRTPDQIRVNMFIRTANRDLAVAELIERDSPDFYESIGFHCQQAVGKYLKAVLVVYNLPVAYTHNLMRLLRDLNPIISFSAAEQAAAISLLQFAVDLRYELDEAPDHTSADLLNMAHQFRDKLRPLALAFLA